MPPATVDAGILELATKQFGVIRRNDALDAGLSNRQVRGRLDGGLWSAHSKDVFLVAGMPATAEQALLAAAWAVAGWGSHTSAGWRHGLQEKPPELPHVSTRFDQCRELHGEQMVIHRPSVLGPADRTIRRGIPVTTVERTLLDLGAVLEVDDVRTCLERALRLRLTHIDRLVARFLRLGGQGRAGSAAARAVLREVDQDMAVLESDLESLLLRVLMDAGLPLPDLQYSVRVGDHRYRLDMAYPDLKIAIEADGFAVHGERSAFENDRRRQNDLVLAGWQVLRFTWRQICREPEQVVAAIRLVLDRATRHRP